VLRHDERAEKDGPAIIWAELQGGRLNTDVLRAFAFAYEIDGKATVGEAMALVGATGREALVHTTHNHWRIAQDVTVATYQKAMGKAPPTTESMRAFCAAHPRYDHLTGVVLLNGGAISKKREYGQLIDKYDIGHDPETKLRIIFPLREPIPVRGSEIGVDGYKRLYHRHGTRVFGDRYSRESCNPARIHYLPAHRPGAPFDIQHFEGELTDWRSEWAGMQEPIRQERKVAQKQREERAKLPPTGLDQLEHVLNSIPADLEYPDWYRVLAALHYETGGSTEGCDLAHAWSQDDPRYRHEQVETIWDSLDPDHRKPATIGTLIRLAQKHDKAFRPLRTAQLHPSIRQWAAKYR
jgi:hypothetical protein